VSEVGNGRLGLYQINLSTLVVLATMLAGLAGTWSVMGERIQNNTDSLNAIRSHIVSLDARLVIAEREAATLAVRFENIREILIEMRRQSGLQPKAIPPTAPTLTP
jgi:hypothetical protein